jgi:hypothetical protein
MRAAHRKGPLTVMSHPRPQPSLVSRLARLVGASADLPAPAPQWDSDPESNRRWLSLVEDCIDLFAELDRHWREFTPANQNLADHVMSRLLEILERSGVEVIAAPEIFDRQRHQPDPAAAAAITDGCPVVVLIPGFVIDGRVARRARVIPQDSA